MEDDDKKIISDYVITVWDTDESKNKVYVKSFRNETFKYTNNLSDAKRYKYAKRALNCLNRIIDLYQGTLFGTTVLGKIVAVKR